MSSLLTSQSKHIRSILDFHQLSISMASSPQKDESIDWRRLKRQKPREIVLSGKQIADQIEKENGLNELLFQFENLNFLSITDANTLTRIEPKISSLSNLTNLVLEGNKLTSVPDELGLLTKLKCLNLARNQIESLPSDLFSRMSCLQTLNVEQNLLCSLPDMSKLTALISLKCGSNRLEKFPVSLCDGIHKNPILSSQSSIPIYEGGAVHLSELHASHNVIEMLPSTIQYLVALKSLDLSFNQIKHIPPELANCHKLKDANLKENPIQDRRLYKLIEQCPTKKVLDYLRNINSSEKSKKDDNEECGLKGDSNSQEFEHTILVQHNVKEKFMVIASKLIISQRKIVACIIHQVDLSNPKILKKFLAIQTRLHQSICDNRQKATIATHDLSKLLPSYASKINASEGGDTNQVNKPSHVVYFDGRVPTKIRLTPLGRASEMTALELYRLLNDEADQHRKEKKRNTISGVHKYIHLLKGKQLYPVLLDYQDKVISLPPLTNSEHSKVGPDCRSVFVEVTGESIPTCRKVMNELIYSFLTASVTNDDGSIVKMFPSEMIIEPVIVEMAETHELMVKYPAKIDLQFEGVQVVYE